jgi:hypothetical protein
MNPRADLASSADIVLTSGRSYTIQKFRQRRLGRLRRRK